jgi:hypothetical protein
MKGILQFDLPEEKEDFEDAQKAWKYKHTLDQVWEKLFRPAHKHGYSDAELDKLSKTKTGRKLLDKLEEEYRLLMRGIEE